MNNSIENVEIISRTNYSELMQQVLKKMQDLFESGEIGITDSGERSENANAGVYSRATDSFYRTNATAVQEDHNPCLTCSMPMYELDELNVGNGPRQDVHCRYCYLE